jgi:hypothetical protein
MMNHANPLWPINVS